MTERSYILAYADRDSLRPGETLRFFVSASGHHRVHCEFVRLLGCDAGPELPPFDPPRQPTAADGDYAVSEQALAVGSGVLIHGSAALAAPAAVTLQTNVMPTLLGEGPRALFGTLAPGARGGLGLRLDETGCLVAVLGDAAGERSLRLPQPLPLWRWSRVGLSYDWATQRLVLAVAPLDVATDGVRPATLAFTDVAPPAAGDGSATIACERDTEGQARYHFDGRIERPRILAVALADSELTAGPAHDDAPALADWDFASDPDSDRVRDRSPHGHEGRCVNLPTRAVQGAAWDGSTLDWRQAPALYDAIHFHHDDTGDLGWPETLSLQVPADWPSGCYAARFSAGEDRFYVAFYVRRSATAPATVAFLAPTATYAAYVNYGGHRQAIEYYSGCLTYFDPHEMLGFELPALGNSLYDPHPDGSERHIGTLRRPVLNLQPDGRPWNFQLDLALLGWLAVAAPDHQVLTDEDLDREGLAALDGCQVLVTGCHPEYWSRPMQAALDGFFARGGRLMYLGGNGFGWSVDFHPTRAGVLELRRRGGNGRHGPGEAHSAYAGRLCGRWSVLGRPEQSVVGVGYVSEAFDRNSYYRRRPAADDPRARFIFAGVDEEILGDFGFLGGAAGLEIDTVDEELGTPRHALVVAASEGHASSYWRMPHGVAFHTGLWNDAPAEPVRADMVFFETTAGGAVFSVGSIGWAGALPHADGDNCIARISANVLRRFRDPTPFVLPS